MVAKFFMPVVALALVLSSSGQCFARLGETEAELIERYGEPVAPEMNESEGGKILCFAKEGVFVQATVVHDRCVSEVYGFVVKDGDKVKPATAKDSMEKIELLLKANARGGKWEKRPPRKLGFEAAKRLLSEQFAEQSDAKSEMIFFWERSDNKAVAFVVTLDFPNQEEADIFPPHVEMFLIADAAYARKLEQRAKEAEKKESEKPDDGLKGF